MMRKIVSWVLCLCMLVSVMPTWSFALAEEEAAVAEAAVQEEQESAPAPEKKPEPAPEAKPAAEPEKMAAAEPAAEPEKPAATEPAAEPEKPAATEPAAEPQEPAATEPAAEPEEPAAADVVTGAEEPAAEPVEEAPAAEETPAEETPAEKIESLCDDETFEQGYVRLIRNASVYPEAKGDDAQLTVEKKSVAYALKRPNAGGKTDRLKVVLSVDGEAYEGYVDAAMLLPLTVEEIEALREALKDAQPVCVQDDDDYPLLAAAYSVVSSAPEQDAPATDEPEQDAPAADEPEQDAPAADEPEQDAPAADEPEQDAPAADEPEQDAPATDEPEQDVPATDAPEQDAPVTDEPEQDAPAANEPEQDAPAADEPEQDAPAADAPEAELPLGEATAGEAESAENPPADEAANMTEATAGEADAAPQGEATASEAEEELEPAEAALKESAYKPLVGLDLTEEQCERAMFVQVSGEMPESNHPYSNNEDSLWHIEIDGTVAAVLLMFNSQTEFEYNYDGLIFYDCNGKYLFGYTGTELATTNVTIPGSEFYMRLVSDGTITRYGFKVDRMFVYATAEIDKITSNGKGAVTVSWEGVPVAPGYQVQRAVINQTTGVVGNYVTVKSGTGKVSVTDTSAKANTLYAYRVRIYAPVGKKKFYTDYDYASIYNFKTTTITSIEKVATGGIPAVRMTWTPVARCICYEVLRATSLDGPYSVVSTLYDMTTTTYTDQPPQKGVYFYKIRPYTDCFGYTFTTEPSDAKAAFCDEAKITGCESNGKGAVTLTWAGNSAAPGYMIQRAVINTKTGIVGKYTTIKTGTGVTSYTDKTAKTGTLYAYRLSNYTTIGKTKYYSAEDTEIFYNIRTPSITGTGAVLDAAVPTVDLKWSAVPNAVYYEVMRSDTLDGTYKLVTTTTDTTFTDRPPKKAMYYYRVKPYAQCNGSTFTTAPSDAKVLGYPALPTNLIATGTNGKTVTLAWDKTPNVLGYAVYYSTSPEGPYKRLALVKSPKYTHTKAAAGTLNYYRVCSYAKVGKVTAYSDMTEPVAVYPLDKPVVKATALSTTSASLSWNAVPNAVYYDVFYSATKDGPFKAVLVTSGTSCTVKNLDEMNEYAYFYVRARRVDGSMTSVSANSVTVSVLTNKIEYRALLIGQTYPGTSSQLYGPANDARGMSSMLKNMTGTKYTVTTMSNLTGSGILSAVGSVFGEADCNDVTLFFYSGHGLYSSNEAALGSLCGVNGTTVSPDQLRTKMDQYQGKKVVIIDSCHSGNMIGKSDGDASAQAFNNAFLAAFGRGAKANLAASGYYVLTAASKSQSSYETKVNGKWYGVFTRALTYGGGWNELSSSRLSKLYADSNGDKRITLNELYNYTRSRVTQLGYGSAQDAQVYPTGSSQVLFGR